VQAANTCTTADDCYLNGECSAEGECRCNGGWTGAHCGQFDLLPTPPGPLGGKAFPPDPDSSCWGSSVVKGRDGRFHMFSSGIEGKCGLAVWAANAALTHAVSDTIDGVFEPIEDIMRGSNPAITEFLGELRLWHTLSGGPGGPGTKGYCSACTNGSTPSTCRNESQNEISVPPGTQVGARSKSHREFPKARGWRVGGVLHTHTQGRTRTPKRTKRASRIHSIHSTRHPIHHRQ